MSRRHRPATVGKALRPVVTPAATFTAAQVQALLGAAQTGGGVATPLPRTEPQVPFGPGWALQPATIDPLGPSGRPEPRIYEYPVTANLPGVGDRLVPWKVLRDAADMPVVRDCIRIRQNQVTTLEWDIVVSKRAVQAFRKSASDTSSVTIQRLLRERLDPEVGRLVDFWAKPDREQGHNFVDWVTALLEEHLVLDAVAIYPVRNRAQDAVVGLRLLDGSTIKPLLSHIGGRPPPPNPAFQQLLWGFPRGEFTADVDADGAVVNPYSADALVYKRRQVRTCSPYGFSQVEQALQDFDLYLRRFEWDKAQYTEGVAPAGWIKNTGVESWTPQQLADYSRAFNALYSGQTLERMRYHLLPPGFEPVPNADIPEKFKPDYHLHLIKLVAMHFDVPISELGFTEPQGLGSSGWHEGQADVGKRTATNPTLEWMAAMFTEISRTHLGMSDLLEFRFLGLDADDEAAADEVASAQMRDGRITRNEAREELGRAPLGFAEADMVAVQTTRGLIFVEGSSTLTPPGVEVAPPAATVVPVAETPEGEIAAGDPPGGEPAPAASSKAAEWAAYTKWCRNAHGHRLFTFRHVDAAEAAGRGVDPARVLFTTP